MKYSGNIGFWEGDIETPPGSGIWIPSIVERHYVGDVIYNYRKFSEESGKQNENFRVSNRISILADLYFKTNYPSIRYIIWNGVKWKVPTVEVSYPRLILEIGEVYNG